MVNILENLRTQAKDSLIEAGVNAGEYVAERIVPPIAIVIPDEPYITPAETFGKYTVNLQVLVIAARGTNRTAAASLDAQVANVITALEDEWDVTEVSQPGEVTLNGNPFMACVVSINTDTNFEEVM